jgi:MFS family permease
MSRQWCARGAVILATFADSSNLTAMPVALPAIQRSLGLTFGGIQWTLAAYLIAYTALTLVGGRLVDLLGPRAVLLAGIVVYLLGAATVAMALNPAMLLGGRVLQGAGAAKIAPSSNVASKSRFTGAALTLTLAMTGSSQAVGLAAGPLIGGLINDHFGWRALFLINVPLLATAIVLAMAGLPSREPSGTHERLDLTAAVELAASLALLTAGLTASENDGFASPVVIIALALAALALLAFIARVRRRDDALLDLSVLRSRPILISALAGAVTTCALTGVLFFEALYMRRVRDLGATSAGLALLPMTGLLAFVMLPSERVLQFFGRRWPAIAGLAAVAAGCITLATGEPGTAAARPLVGLSLIGAGLGMTWIPVLSLGLRDAAPSKRGQAAGAVFTARWIGAAAGLPILAMAYRIAADRRLNTLLPVRDPRLAHNRYDRLDQLLSGSSAHGALLSQPPAVRAAAYAAVRDAASSGTAHALVLIAVLAALGTAAVFLFPRERGARWQRHRDAAANRAGSGAAGRSAATSSASRH